MKAVKISVGSIVVILIVAVVFLTFSLGNIVKKGIETVGPKVLGVNVTVDSVDVSITNGSAQITGLTVGNPDGFKSDNAFYLGDVNLKLDPMSIFSDTVEIEYINILAPEITYEVGVGKTNISTLQQNIGKGKVSKSQEEGDVKTSASEVQADSKASKKVVIKQVVISEAKVKAAIAGVEEIVLLPAIQLNNIGSQSEPATFVVATKKILSAVILKLSNADLGAISGGIVDKLEGSGAAITDGIKNIGNSIKGMFK